MFGWLSSAAVRAAAQKSFARIGIGVLAGQDLDRHERAVRTDHAGGHLLDLTRRSQSFSDLAAYFAFYGVGDNNLTGTGEPERLSAVPVTQNFFPVLGVQPVIGRGFTAEEASGSGPSAVLLSYGLWARRFASDRGILGRSLTLNNQRVTVVGVLLEWFDFGSVFAPGSHIDLFTPFPLIAQTDRWGNTLSIVGRLEPGVTPGRR